ncbi:hypothetical protein pdul_cds_77 [Pandoravirus dulcis]|uniref:Ankyrin repeat domain containing protein n=1 Tax=Pandoravirus dulcis TaxID=1349409 RepID=S4VVK8_9VIRU|nr:hypothetical protein pdul_cds_77 [Pandoravirus dulcis]AGO81969.2 hypothetical protein pdul_cds_77 [Pandoravirus dulcis]
MAHSCSHKLCSNRRGTATAIVSMVAVLFATALWPHAAGAANEGIGPVERLWEAAARCDTDVVHDILASAPWSAAAVLPDGRGTALHAVATSSSTGACLAVAAALMRSGADPLIVDAAGRTAVDAAKAADVLDQRPDRPPMGLFLASVANGERADIMRRHGPLEGDAARPPR